MVYYDTAYTNGVIAAREKYLLKDKIVRLCELTAEDAFRALTESGYGGNAVAANVYDFEKLIAEEENALDAFIREYAPSEAEKAYLLAPRDFHNAKALLKAAYLQTDAEKLLAPEGNVAVAKLAQCVENKDFSALKAENGALAQACEDALTVLEKGGASGARVGAIFEKALYGYLAEKAKRRPTLKRLLAAKADMTNILTAFRAGDAKLAREGYLPAGKLKEEELEKLFDEDQERAAKAFADTEYAEFVGLCFSAKEKGLPMTEAERIAGGYDATYFAERKYELKRSEPFLYYAYRRRAENANVRIVFVCLLAGMDEQSIKKRLRAI